MNKNWICKCYEEFCPSCEAEANYNSNCLDSAQKADLMLDYLVDELANKDHVKATEITALKLMLSNDDVSGLFSIIFAPRGVSAWYYIQRKLLDAKFERKLELKIMKAKSDLN